MMQRIRRGPQSLAEFLVMVAAITAAFWILPNEHDGSVDPWILVLLTTAFFFASFVVIAATSVWTQRGLGVLGGLLGDAFLYLSFVITWATGENGWWSEHTRDLARGFFLAGMPLLIIGLFRYVNDQSGMFGTMKPNWYRRRKKPPNGEQENA